MSWLLSQPTESWREPPEGEFLHGTLHVMVYEARNLYNADCEFIAGFTDAYVRLIVDHKKGPRTLTINNSLNPEWNEELYFRIGWKAKSVVLKIKDADVALISHSIGEVELDIADIIAGTYNEDTWLPISSQGELRISARFVDASEEAAVVEAPSRFKECPGNRVTLFQDAHFPADCFVPDVPIASGIYDKHNPAWETVYKTIQAAQHFIYITGWSVWTDLYLLRERPLGDEGFVKLGDLLKQKAEEGVRVLLLVWNELLSMDNKFINNLVAQTQSGLLGTHDEETRKFFEDSKVVCRLVLRHGRGCSTLGNITALTSVLALYGPEAVFSHHQKSITCDAPSEVEGKRRIVAFVGGLDLTNGRFDTPDHPLFSTLHTWHKGDFYQGYAKDFFDPEDELAPVTWMRHALDRISTASSEFMTCGSRSLEQAKIDRRYNVAAGPREPWHDVHAFIEGPIAYDIIINFEQRWKKQAAKDVDKLANLYKLPILSLEDQAFNIPGAWTCQMFRSIDSWSAALDESGVEHSICDAYIHHIRRAEKFIYIENQYFLGSSQEWVGFDEKQWNIECKHRIPAELVSKVVAKIRAGERFAIYVVIPMHPEGAPEDAAMQAILHWQFKTVEFMYKRIAAAIQECGPEGAHPTDYLNFFFLGQREPEAEVEIPIGLGRRQTNQILARRQMIYVHCKLMIVDDEYLIIGSANINERSMAGDRDTEICVGMYQPDFMLKDGQLPRGQVSGFRLSLWGEHTAVFDELFLRPHDVDCVQKVNSIADANWAAFSSDVLLHMPSHLCKYPYRIFRNGNVEAVQPCFPDMAEFRAFITGAPQMKVPNLFTT